MPPNVTSTWSGVVGTPLTRVIFSAMAFLRAAAARGVYFVSPADRAATVASLMNCGVSKSGSPAPKLTTSIPSACICLAAVVIAMVGLAETC